MHYGPFISAYLSALIFTLYNHQPSDQFGSNLDRRIFWIQKYRCSKMLLPHLIIDSMILCSRARSLPFIFLFFA